MFNNKMELLGNKFGLMVRMANDPWSGLAFGKRDHLLCDVRNLYCAVFIFCFNFKTHMNVYSYI